MSSRTARILAKTIDRDLKRGSKAVTKFKTGLIDPPWETLTYSGKGLPQRAKKQHYPTMPLAEMKALPVGDLFEADACLFMWSLGSHVDQAIKLAEHWGFKYNTDVFYWRKVTLAGLAHLGPDQSPLNLSTLDSDTYAKMGMGKWARKQMEPCYLFTRGKPSPIHGSKTGVRQIIDAPIREHSRKPDEIYDRIEAIAPGPFVELFSRTTAPGWVVWGNEAGKFDPKPHRREARSASELLA